MPVPRSRAPKACRVCIEVADVVIDNGGVVGDAAIDIEGFEVRVAPTSTLVGAAILNAMTAEAVERLWRADHPRRSTRAAMSTVGTRERPVPVARERSVIRNGAATPFAVRGVIEGFYGNPWTREQRLELIAFLAAHEMNTFVYTPKDDSLVRRAWREAYMGNDLQRLTELVERCAAHGIEFVYCLSPGLSIRYSDPDDIEALSAKFSSVAALGVRTFGLLLDDIPTDLQHQADRATFPDLAGAHVHLVNQVAARLGPDRALVVCPTVYWGRGDDPYLARLGGGIDPRIDVFWSGSGDLLADARLR